MFASASLSRHLFKGFLGVVLTAFAFYFSGTNALASIAAGIAALLAFRGCPVCWTVGLVKTVSTKLVECESCSTKPPAVLG